MGYNLFMRFRQILALSTAVVLLSVTLGGGFARAAGSVSVSPLRKEIELKPGQSVSGTFWVRNTSQKSANFLLSAETFNVINENYDYEFAEAQDLPEWINFKESSAVIEPSKSHNFNYIASVPLGAEGGAKYIVIFASTTPVKQSSTISSVERAGMLLYINVPGNDNNRRGELLDLKLPKFTIHKTVEWNMRIQGSGNAHFRSPVSVKVRDIFGRNISSTNANHLIMPKSTRALRDKISFGRLPGIYRVNFSVGLGDNTTANKTKWIVYLPPVSTTLISIVILICGVMLYRLKRNKRL